MPTLQGKRILITREKSQANTFATLIKKYDGIPIKVPLLNITCRIDFLKMLEESKDITRFEWIFFTSAHGVDCFFEQIGKVEPFTYTKFATVGHKTEKALKKHGYSASFIPSTYNAEVMSEEFFENYPHANHILLVRGNLSRKLLFRELTRRNLDFATVIVYDTTHFLSMKEMLIHVLTAENLDYLTFTSPSTVKAFMEMVGEHPEVEEFLKIPTVCIGTTTEKTALSFQFKQTIVPEEFTIESMVETMLALEKSKI